MSVPLLLDHLIAKRSRRPSLPQSGGCMCPASDASDTWTEMTRNECERLAMDDAVSGRIRYPRESFCPAHVFQLMRGQQRRCLLCDASMTEDFMSPYGVHIVRISEAHPHSYFNCLLVHPECAERGNGGGGGGGVGNDDDEQQQQKKNKVAEKIEQIVSKETVAAVEVVLNNLWIRPGVVNSFNVVAGTMQQQRYAATTTTLAIPPPSKVAKLTSEDLERMFTEETHPRRTRIDDF